MTFCLFLIQKILISVAIKESFDKEKLDMRNNLKVFISVLYEINIDYVKCIILYSKVGSFKFKYLNKIITLALTLKQ